MDKEAKELIPSGLKYIAENITTRHNVPGLPKDKGSKWAKDLNLTGEAKTIFFAGCGYQYASGLESLMSLLRRMDKSPIGAELPMGFAGVQQKLGINLGGVYSKLAVKDDNNDGKPLRDAVKVLNNLGVEVGYLAEDEPCCGGLLHYTGLENEFAQNARKAYEVLKAHGVQKIISIVPSCTYTLRNLMPKYIEGYDLEVKHFLEVVLEAVGSRELRFPRQVRVTYHDPCQLARYLNLVEEPRKILKSIKNIELIEPSFTSGEMSTCCGGGGGFEAVFPELSEVLAVNRTRELVDTGAEIIITHCPGCLMQLNHGLEALKVKGVEVLDLAQVLATAMGV